PRWGRAGNLILGRARTLGVGDSDAGAPNVLAAVLFIAVGAAALVSLALIQEARQRGEVLDLVEATDSFAPRAGESARIEWRQRETSDDALGGTIETGCAHARRQ